MGRPGSAQGWVLETNVSAVADRFRNWHSAMQQPEQKVASNLWWLDEEHIALKLNRREAHGINGADLATNRGCSPAAVQINMPSQPGDVDGSTQVGRDPADRVWLLRQGRLHANGISSNLIDGQQFQNLTGITRAFETPASGSNPARWWFRVCRLDAEVGFIREQTVEFVRLCQQARELAATATAVGAPAGNSTRAVNLQGNLEPTGSYVIPPHDGRVASRWHGEVVNALKRCLVMAMRWTWLSGATGRRPSSSR
jgi:hypothetical protein